MKYQMLIYLICATVVSCNSQEVFQGSYYYIQKDNTRKFEQRKDSIFVTKSNKNGFLNSEASFFLLIEKQFLINDSIVELSFRGEKPKANYVVTDICNNRKRLKYIYAKSKIESSNILLYPESELKDLKSVNAMSSDEINLINNKLMLFIKSNFDPKSLDYDDNVIWEKFNEFVIEEGYNPIGAQPILDKAFSKS